jgi:hypothetical protein
LDIPELKAPLLDALHGGKLALRDFVLSTRLSFARDIVKEPLLTFLYDQLVGLFPSARFMMILRDPRDNIRSILDRLKVPGFLEHIDPYDFSEINPVWRRVIDGSLIGLKGANYIEMLAVRWNKAVDIYLENANNITLIRYEDFLNDKVGAINQLALQLGYDAVNDISGKVDIQFQPPGNRDVRWQEFFGTANLDRINLICGERMQRVGYRPGSLPSVN